MSIDNIVWITDNQTREMHVNLRREKAGQQMTYIAEQLRAKRGDASKRSVYTRLNVSSQTYDAWESGLYVPGDEYAELLADYLEQPLVDIVWMLYASRTGKGEFSKSYAIPRYRELAALAA